MRACRRTQANDKKRQTETVCDLPYEPEYFRIAATIKSICQQFNQGSRMTRFFNRHTPAIALILLSAAAIDLHAQDAAQEQKALAESQAKITSLRSNQTATTAQLKKLKAERPAIEKSIEPATQEFEAVKAARDQAVAEAKTNPSDTTQKLADNANFKFMLAERKYNKSKEALDAHDAKVAELEKRIASDEAAIKSSQNAVEQQKAGLEQQQKQSAEKAKLAAAAATQKKEQELQQNKAALAETQAKAAAAQAEVEKLKKALAEKQVQDTAAKAAVPPTVAPAAAAIGPAAATKTAEVVKAAPVDTKPTQDFKALHAAYAQREATVSKRAMRGISSKIIYIKTTAGGKTALSLPALTPDLFRGVAPLAAGDYDFVLGLQTWKQTVSAADGGKKFIVNIDTKNGKPELVIYPEDAAK